MKVPKAGILSVGDELLGGRIVNTNAAFVATRLSEAGFLVTATETVGDEEFAIADAIQGLRARAEAIVVIGGLGPTPDDVTRQALAGTAGKLLVEDRKLLKEIANRAGNVARKRNARMARIPEGATTFPNRIGMARGLLVDVGGTPVYALPGVPLEMQAMFEEEVVPDLEERFSHTEPIPLIVLHIFGLREAEVADRLGELLDRHGEPAVGVTAKHGLVTATIIGEGAEERAAAIRERLGDHVFGAADESLAGVVFHQLRAQELTVAIAESMTGGMLASLLVEEPGASQVLRGGVVAYTNDVKHELLGVPKALLKREGAVSREVALRMARGARKVFGADVALATTGIAGPDTDERGTPVGTVFVAVAGPRAGKAGETVKELHLKGERQEIRWRASYAAFDLLRRQLRAAAAPTRRLRK